MTAHDAPDRITAWLEEEAAPHAPTGLHARFVEDLASTPQRPSWATTERWISMETRAQLGAVPRAAIILVTLGILVALAAGAIVAGSSSTPSLPPPFGAAANGLIAYSSEGDIHVVAPDGSGSRAITSGPEYDFSPYWSRDGRRVAFWSEPGDGSPPRLVVVDPDGEGAMTVAQSAGPGVGYFLTWSEDSSEIIYSAEVPELAADPCPVADDSGGMCGFRVFIAPIDGSGARQVGDPELDARNPELSPDGRTIAFGGGVAASEGLYVMDRGGGDAHRLTSEAVPSGNWGFVGQSWSADGARIVTQDGSGFPDIWLVEADGSGERDVSNHFSDETWARFAPTGDAISWSRGGVTLLRSPDEDGEAVELAGITNVAWSPDGKLLVGVGPLGRTLVVIDREGNVQAEIDAPEPGLVISWQRLAP